MSALPVSSPHAHDRSSVTRIMGHVCLALTPCTAFGLWQFGWPAIFLWLVTCGAAVITEAACLHAQGASLRRLLDGSALLTGWLIALSLPPWAPWWLGAGGAAFALGIGKHLYGGIGQNVFNPAMLARVALLIAFPLQMTSWFLPAPLGSDTAPGFSDALAITFSGAAIPDSYSGATALGHLRTSFTLHQDARDVLAQDFSLLNAVLGTSAGSLGETSEVLVLLGGVWLLALRIISWEIPLAMLLSVALLALVSSVVTPQRYGGPLFHLTSGGVLLGALFIATDPVTSPASRVAKLVFGAGCGVVTFVIRCWGTFPEAVGFAVLFMNALTPLLDRYLRPRIYGRLPGGKPLQAASVTTKVKGVGKT